MSSRRLTTSFVITLAALPACASGNAGPGPEEPNPSSKQIEHRPDGTCWEVVHASCPENATCNPPPPAQVDCATGEPVPYDPQKEGYPYATPPPDGGS